MSAVLCLMPVLARPAPSRQPPPPKHCACAAAALYVHAHTTAELAAGQVQYCQVKSPSMHRPVPSNPVQRDAVAARSWWPATGRQDRPIHSPHANRPGSHARTGPSWACGQTRQVRELLDRLVPVRMRNRSSIRSNAVWLPAHRAQKQFLYVCTFYHAHVMCTTEPGSRETPIRAKEVDRETKHAERASDGPG